MGGGATKSTVTNVTQPSAEQSAAIAYRQKILEAAMKGLGSQYNAMGTRNPQAEFAKQWARAMWPPSPADASGTPPPGQIGPYVPPAGPPRASGPPPPDTYGGTPAPNDIGQQPTAP